MSGGGHLALIGQHGQKRLHIGHTHLSRMTHAAELRSAPADEKTDPIEVSFLGFEAIVEIPNPLAHLIEQAGGMQARRNTFFEKKP